MSLSKDTVHYVAHLARIALDPQELERLAGQLDHIVQFIDTLNKVETKDVEPTSHIHSLKNILREDHLGMSLPVEKALMNAPKREGTFFVVPQVIEGAP